MTTDISFSVPSENEPKRVNRWVVIFPKAFNLESWVVKETERPSITLSGNTSSINPIKFVFLDPIGPSTTERLFKIIRSTPSIVEVTKKEEDNDLINTLKDGFDYQLELLNSRGESIEKWTIVGCNIISVDFGSLDYDIDKLVTCLMVVQPKDFKLHENEK